MIFPTLAFIVYSLLTQGNKAAWRRPIPKCWKNSLGHCRVRCQEEERYIYLCKNKVSCCIHRTLSEDKLPSEPPIYTVTRVIPSFTAPVIRFIDNKNWDANESKTPTGTTFNPAGIGQTPTGTNVKLDANESKTPTVTTVNPAGIGKTPTGTTVNPAGIGKTPPTTAPIYSWATNTKPFTMMSNTT
ncbi:beta-defensin 125 [Mus caroli]|uniref:Beta-defensin n=1 Tax=Mus caroli TaxID=10089 RepID=A0A6P5PI00_MUSCR|nr:beta-defensin 125 [Mus caroli]